MRPVCVLLRKGGRHRPAQLRGHGIDAGAGLGMESRRGAVAIVPHRAHNAEPLLELIVDEENSGNEEGTIRQILLSMPVRQFFHKAHHVIAQIAHQAAVKVGQALRLGYAERGHQFP